MDALRQDLRLAVRGFRGTATLAALCLALGIGGGTLVFSVTDAILLRRLPLPDADRLVVMVARHPECGSMAVRPGNCRALLARTHVFMAAGGELDPVSVTLNDPAAPAHLSATLVTDGWFQAVGVRPELGRLFGDSDYNDPHAAEFLGHRGPTVLTSDRLWRDRFHVDRAVIGRSLDLDGSAMTVVGVPEVERRRRTWHTRVERGAAFAVDLSRAC
jgi:putative ABC transport system permease protein